MIALLIIGFLFGYYILGRFIVARMVESTNNKVRREMGLRPVRVKTWQ